MRRSTEIFSLTVLLCAIVTALIVHMALSWSDAHAVEIVAPDAEQGGVGWQPASDE